MYLIQQRSDNDCALAAIAMALGYTTWSSCWTDEDLQTVIDSKGVSDLGAWLEKKGLSRGRHFTEAYTHGARETASLLWGRRALVSVNSLNHSQGSHLIYYDGERVWDPQEGVEGKQHFKYLSTAVINRVVLLKAAKHGNP